MEGDKSFVVGDLLSFVALPFKICSPGTRSLASKTTDKIVERNCRHASFVRTPCCCASETLTSGRHFGQLDCVWPTLSSYERPISLGLHLLLLKTCSPLHSSRSLSVPIPTTALKFTFFSAAFAQIFIHPHTPMCSLLVAYCWLSFRCEISTRLHRPRSNRDRCPGWLRVAQVGGERDMPPVSSLCCYCRAFRLSARQFQQGFGRGSAESCSSW